MVDIYVGKGDAEKHFHIHKLILCKKVEYFDKMFGGGFKEAHENVGRFPEDNPDSMDVLLEWVYTGTLRKLTYKPGTKQATWQAIKFYSLVEKFCLPILMDQTMDELTNYESENNMIFSFDEILSSYSSTSENSGLRQYAARSLIYILFKLKSENSRKIWPLSGIQKTLENCPDLHRDFLLLQEKMTSSAVADPANAPRCDYHGHAKDGGCSTNKKPT